MIHCKMIHKKTLKTRILCYIHVMTVQENGIRQFLTSVFEEADDEEVGSFKQ